MSSANLALWVTPNLSKVDTFGFCSQFQSNPFGLSIGKGASLQTPPRALICCGIRELRERMQSVKNTKKITEAMKLVAAAKVRLDVLYDINERLQPEDVNVPLTEVRPVKKVALVVVTGDRGLCGGFNNAVLRKAEAQFEQDPVQIIDAMMPLYLNSQILRALQESYASELASRMNAMSNATDNAVELTKNLSVVYNRERQAKITGELLEIIAGADALKELP
ncbi:unnamed protein product [Linum tenue]|uniref:F-ATPase gamma subunit n=1 Tax=Linum tenue TaxID=586396 RepID=A0AAV0H5N0_9ROSI|nr:unnamed protein product [Linum tenue]CAI0379824.1 unnamed protein product [Linum tenue]